MGGGGGGGGGGVGGREEEKSPQTTRAGEANLKKNSGSALYVGGKRLNVSGGEKDH